ncbi:MAG TPA: PhoH family protein [Candidatus Aphodomorpha intestinavium]|uniref:PhoH-like protein n=1 Tax=Candidatus Aphodomorpha intestinavium TaxID=2840672 RepID=A0A9D1STF3_9FIRM|nr:PhoH family protein [Candidatus Aphodomorpha intestinavium]
MAGTNEKTTQIVCVEAMDDLVGLFGVFDENLRVIEEETGTRITATEEGLCIEGGEEMTALTATVLETMLDMQRRGEPVNRSRIRYAVDLAREGNAELIPEIMGDVVAITSRGRQVRCKTLGQKRYVQALREHELVFGVGPAGTGKTYLAVAMAVLAFKNKEVDRIILTRPAVEAGEKLGFLPGDLQTKVDPYLRPLYDALQDFLGIETYRALTERGAIEVAPLAYMRGRTLNSAYIILDEAQNCSIEQMKMFLTRFGEGSRVVVTGDITQIDLPREKRSGLVHALEVLEGVEGIEIVRLTHKDVVRHELVQRIIRAYEKYEKHRN